ncbi:MAG: hypothetical protein J2P41_08940 [Blastocatellia bacterium]|nr:hypothetical protein [Blastocatellia bacterium]
MEGSLPIIQLRPAALAANAQEKEKPLEQKPEKTQPPEQNPTEDPKSPQQTQQQDHRSFWQKLFKLPPLQTRIEKSLNEEWKFPEVRSRHIEYLMSEDGEEARQFFLNNLNARRYQRLLKEFGCGFQDRNGNIVDDNFDTINEYGPELIEKYPILIENRDLIKKYYAGVFHNGRIGTQSLIRISNSMWFGPFETSKFKMSAAILNTRFQVPNHVIGPMLSSVGDSYWLRRVLSRRTAPQEFQQLLNRISPSVTDGSGNAFAPALQLLVLGEEHKISFNSLDNFLQQLKLEPKDFGPFSATVYHLGPYRLANEVKCPTFALFLRRILDEFGPDINQETARHFLLSFREFKDNTEALNALLSPQYQETRAFLRSIGTPVPSTVWNMERIAILSQILTPEKKQKIATMVRQLTEEVKVADVVFLADISGNEEECKLLLNRPALLAAVKELKIDRVVERSHNDLVKELEREIDAANRNGFYRTVRRLTNLVSEEKKTYTESVDPSKLSNIQLSRLLIVHRSIEMPGFLETLGWNVSLDLQNDRSEGGGYLGYDKDMAMVTIIPGIPGDNRQYRPENLFRAPASLALFHNHALNDSVMERLLGFVGWGSPASNKNKYAGPSGWVGAKKGDITAAAESDLPSFIITKIGYAQKPDGKRDKKNLLVDLDWVLVDRQTGEALRSDRGVFTVPYFGEDQLGKLKWPSKKEKKRQEREKQEKCPPVLSVDTTGAQAH